jgi:hypothetical protein
MLAAPTQEHTVPWFWPLAAGIELADEGLKFFGDNLKVASAFLKLASCSALA